MRCHCQAFTFSSSEQYKYIYDKGYNLNSRDFVPKGCDNKYLGT